MYTGSPNHPAITKLYTYNYNMKIFLCPSKIRVQLQLVKLGVGHGAQLGDGAVSQGQQLGLVRLQVVAHLGQGLDGGSPVFRRSTRNVPEFLL